MLLSPSYQKMYQSFFIASLIAGFFFLLPLPLFYVHFYYSIFYFILFFIGLLLANMGFLLFRWAFMSPLEPSFFLYIIMFISIFLFPFTNSSHLFSQAFQITLLVLSLFIGFFAFFTSRAVIFMGMQPYFFSPIIVSLLAVLISLFCQFSLKEPSWELMSFLLFSFLCCLSISRKYWSIGITFFLFVFGFISIVVFAKLGLFYIKSTKVPLQTRIFHMGEQLDIYTPQTATKEELDISDNYKGSLDTYKDIYLNGRYYGQLVENEHRKEYANQTPLSVLFSIQENPSVLILNSDGGSDVSLTHILTNGSIDALEENQDILDQIRDKESLYVGGIYHNRNTLFYHSSVRPYIATTSKKYDSIILHNELREKKDIFFLQEKEPQFSTNAIKGYLNVLNQQGILFVSFRSFSKDLDRIMLLSFISTLSSAVPIAQSIWEQYLFIFESGQGSYILFSKTPFTEEKRVSYKKKIQELGYQDILGGNLENELSKDIKALLYGDKNRQHIMSIHKEVMKDNGYNWFFTAVRHTPSLKDSIFLKIEEILGGGIVLCLLFLGLSWFRFKKTPLFNMGLGRFFPYVGITGISFGLDIGFGIEFSSMLQQNSFGFYKIFLAFLVGSQILTLMVWAYARLRLYIKIQISLSVQLLIHTIIFFIFSIIFETILVMPLILRLILPAILLFSLYLFSFSTLLLKASLIRQIQERNLGILVSVIILGFILGLSLSFIIFFYMSIAFSLGISIILILLLIFYGNILDRKMKMMNYLYKKGEI